MRSKYSLIILLAVFTSCLAHRETNICFNINPDKAKTCSYSTAQYFPFQVSHSYYNLNKDEIEIVSYLVLADSNYKVKLNLAQPYLIKGGDTIRLKEIEKFNRYSYPNILNEPVIHIHFDYTVLKKLGGSVIEIKEDFKLYRGKNTFRTVH